MLFKHADVLLEYVDLHSGTTLCMCLCANDPRDDKLEFISLDCASRKYGSRDQNVNIVLMELINIRQEFFTSSSSARPPPDPQSDDPVYDEIKHRAKQANVRRFHSHTHTHTHVLFFRHMC